MSVSLGLKFYNKKKSVACFKAYQKESNSVGSITQTDKYDLKNITDVP